MAALRIVSLLPSTTEIVCALGLAERLVGVPHECDRPPEVARLPAVTRTVIPHAATSAEIDALVRERVEASGDTRPALYTLDEDALAALAPDLIVTQALCDVCAVAEAGVRAAGCRMPGAPRVLNLEFLTLADVTRLHRRRRRGGGGLFRPVRRSPQRASRRSGGASPCGRDRAWRDFPGRSARSASGEKLFDDPGLST